MFCISPKLKRYVPLFLAYSEEFDGYWATWEGWFGYAWGDFDYWLWGVYDYYGVDGIPGVGGELEGLLSTAEGRISAALDTGADYGYGAAGLLPDGSDGGFSFEFGGGEGFYDPYDPTGWWGAWYASPSEVGYRRQADTDSGGDDDVVLAGGNSGSSSDLSMMAVATSSDSGTSTTVAAAGGMGSPPSAPSAATTGSTTPAAGTSATDPAATTTTMAAPAGANGTSSALSPQSVTAMASGPPSGTTTTTTAPPSTPSPATNDILFIDGQPASSLPNVASLSAAGNGGGTLVSAQGGDDPGNNNGNLLTPGVILAPNSLNAQINEDGGEIMGDDQDPAYSAPLRPNQAGNNGPTDLANASGVEGDHWYSSGQNWYPGGYFNPANVPIIYTAVNGIQQWQRGRTLDQQRRALEVERDKTRTTEEKTDYALDPKRGPLIPGANLTTDRRVHATAEQLEDDANTAVAVLGTVIAVGSVFLPGPEDVVMGAVVAKFGYRFVREGKLLKIITGAGEELTEAEAKLLLDSYTEASKRALWRMTPAMTDAKKVVGGRTYYRHRTTGLWWSPDTAGHGGSAWKVFKEGPGGTLEWYRDADIWGDFIDPAAKHKGPVGRSIGG